MTVVSYTHPITFGFKKLVVNTGLGVTSDLSVPQSFSSDVKLVSLDPSWRSKVARGSSASLPYTRSGFEVFEPGLLQLRDYQPSTQRFSTLLLRSMFAVDPLMFTPFDSSYADNIAIAKIRRKINDSSGQFQSLVPIAEARELHGLVGSLADKASSLIQSFQDLKSGKTFRKLVLRARKSKRSVKDQIEREILNIGSDLWLTWGFGVRPLLDDTDALMKAIAYHINNRSTIRFRGRAFDSWNTNLVPQTSSSAGDYSGYQTTFRVEYSVRYQYSGGQSFGLLSANNYNNSIATDFGLRLENLIPALWEATALSWVVDYFTTMGDFLSDTFVKPPGLTTYIDRSRLCTITVVATTVPFATSSNILLEHVSKPVHLKWFHFSRTQPSGLPVRSIALKTSSQVGNYAVSKVLNLASVYIQRSSLKIR